ncbi:DUF2637 domain-containing protein, partial [Streptomyces sp. WAC01280]|uniref:DUF2637 domain-containing protein n=1 Tax=Streptomyces sp. WAC01280 TaxID=2487424 RepID=UPI000F76E514
MTTTVEPLHRVPAPADAFVRTAPSTTPAAPSAASQEASATAEETSATPARTVSRRTKRLLIGFGIFGSVVIGAIGFLLSFDNLTTAGEKWGFGDRASWFAVGIDASILTFLVVDLVLVIFDVRFGLLRRLAHVMTGATVFFNATAHGNPLDHPVRSLAHGLMPVLFVSGIEAGRRILIKQAALEQGREHDPIPGHRWFLAPLPTWRLFRRMKLWEIRSYTTAVELERDRAIYAVYLKHREELEAGHKEGQVGALDRLPMTMKRFGMSVDEALALPAKMKRDEQQRRQNAAEAELHLELDQERAEAEAKKQRLLIKGEIAAVSASVKAGTGVAEAEADAAEAAARLQATTTLQAAERAATAAQRRAEEEEIAEESAKVAVERAKEKAALAKVAEDEARVVEAERKKTEESSKVAVERAKEKAALAKVAEDEARVLEAQRKVDEESARIAQAR